MKLADGVEELLGGHIEREHRGQISQHNGGLAVNLVEAAIGKMAGRVVKAGAGAISDILTAEDFEIDTTPPLELERHADSLGRPLQLQLQESAELELRSSSSSSLELEPRSSSSSSSSSVRRAGSPPTDSSTLRRQSSGQKKLLAEIEALKRQLATEVEKRAKEEALRKAAETALLLTGPAAATTRSPAASPISSPDRDSTLCRARSASPSLGGAEIVPPVQAS